MNPHQVQEAAERRLILSEEYSRFSDEMGLLEQLEAVYVSSHKDEYKTDKATQRAWDASEKGQRLIYLKRRCKGLEKEMSALNTLVQVANTQARNLY